MEIADTAANTNVRKAGDATIDGLIAIVSFFLQQAPVAKSDVTHGFAAHFAVDAAFTLPVGQVPEDRVEHKGKIATQQLPPAA